MCWIVTTFCSLSGKDVVILQNLLPRSYNVTSSVKPTGVYDKQTAIAVAQYKDANRLTRFYQTIIYYFSIKY